MCPVGRYDGYAEQEIQTPEARVSGQGWVTKIVGKLNSMWIKSFILACRALRVGVEVAMVAATLWFLIGGSDRAWKIALLLAVIDAGMAVKERDR